MLKCSSGKCILYSRCCGSKGQFLGLTVKLLRTIVKWCSQELFYGEEKDLGKASRSLWFCCLTPAQHFYILACYSKEWSQNRLPKTLPKSLPCLFVFSFFLVIELTYKYIRGQRVQKKLGAQLSKAGFSGLKLCNKFHENILRKSVHLEVQQISKNKQCLKFRTSLKTQDVCRADV